MERRGSGHCRCPLHTHLVWHTPSAARGLGGGGGGQRSTSHSWEAEGLGQKD